MKRIMEYRFSVGDIIKRGNFECKILEQKRSNKNNKMYLIKCIKCGEESNILEPDLCKKTSCKFCKKTHSKNKFILSEDKTYWIGITARNEKFLFNGDKQTINYIKSNTWFKKGQKYIVNTKGKRLHRIVMGVTNPKIFVNHLGGNTLDNRIEKLSISNCVDNTKEKKSKNNKIIGLYKARKNKYYGRIQINEIKFVLQAKPYNEALIDLLIVQKKYGFRHNINLYYLLDNISQDYINNIEKLYDDKFLKYSNKIKIVNFKNKYEIINDYVKVYDSKNKCFIIDKENLNNIKNGNWSCYYKKQDNKWYVKGRIIKNGQVKQVLLHRYLKDIIDNKYSLIFIDHLDGNGLNNKLNNLVYTNAHGNSINNYGENVRILGNGKYNAYITINRKHYSKNFNTYEEAKEWYKNQKDKLMEERLIFNNKEEIDDYINNKIV